MDWRNWFALVLTFVTAIAAGQTREGCTPAPAEMAAWWPLDTAAQSSTPDISGRHAARLVNAPSIAPGRVGNAMSFTAGQSRLDVADADGLDIGTGDFSVDFWMRTTNVSSLITILDKRTLSPAVRGYSVFLTGGKLGIQLADSSAPSPACSSDSRRSACTNYGSNVVVADGAWHFVVITVDRDSKQGGRIIVDGRVIATFDPTVRRGSLSNTAPLRIGASADTVGSSYRGLLDEVELFRRVLSDAEIRAIHAAGSAGKCKPRIVNVPGSPTSIALTGTGAYSVSVAGEPFGRPVPERPRLELRYKRFDPLKEKVTIAPALLQQDDSEVSIVQFITQPLDAYRRVIASAGGSAYTYLPDQALLVRLTPQARRSLQAQPFVRWIGPYHPVYKLEEELRAAIAANRKLGPTRYNIQLLDRGGFASPVIARIRELGGKIENIVPQGFRLEATLDDAHLIAVARLWQVLFIDRWSPPQPDMDIARQIGGANQLTGVAGYTGQGVRGEALDSGLRVTHVDFAAVPPLLHGANSTNTSHGTSVYGIVFGSGANAGQGRGLLPGGQGIFASYASLTNRYTHTADLIDATKPFRASFQTNSWGTALTTAYTTDSSELDDILFLNDLLVTQSQSNDGTTSSRPQAWAKNVVSVGGIKHFNSLVTTDDTWTNGASIGPAADGRLKPDLSHFYDSVFTASSGSDTSNTATFNGTSAATPITGGHFGLLFQMWADGVFSGFPGKHLDVFASRPHATTAKALMINSAWQYPFTGAGHDRTRTHQGWGRADVGNLYDLARKDGWKLPLLIDQTREIYPFGTHSYSVNVGGNAADTLWLKATLVYPDPAGNPSSTKHRVNDLTLRVTAPDGTSYFGNNGLGAGVWSTSGGVANDVDTVENVFLPDGPPGAYKIEVLADAIVQDGNTATPLTDAVYSLVVTRALGSCTTPPAGMVGWWAFDGPLGAVTVPVSDIQAGHNAAPVGQVTLLAGAVKQGGRFDVDSWVEVADDPSLDFGPAANGNFSIDAWYQIPPEAVITGDDDLRVVASKIETGPGSSQTGYDLYLGPGVTSADPENFILKLADGTATEFASVVDATLPGWHHIAVTVDRNSTTGGRFYLDGVEIVTAQFDPTVRSGSLANAAPLKMGKLSGTAPWALDEVEIFSRVLSSTEIAAIYQAGSQGKCKVDLWVEDTPYNDTSAAPDTGEEPDANMTGKPIWASRSMWVHSDASPCAGTTHLTHSNPEFGSPNTLCVEVKNRGSRTGTATVETYFAAASSGLPWTSGVWTLIGMQSVTIPASGQQIVQIPWNNVPDPTSEPNGHFCLITRLVSTEDPMTHPEGTNLGANVVHNNNISWRNVNVINFVMKTNETFHARIRNVQRERAPVDVMFRGADGFIADGGTLVVDLGPLFAPWRQAGSKGRNVTALAGTKVQVKALPATIEGLVLAAGEERALQVTAQAREPMPRAGVSTRYTVDVAESIAGVEIGGVSYSITTRARDTDTDGDGILDVRDPDDDNDGIPDSSDPNPVGMGGCPRGAKSALLRGLHFPLKQFPTCAAATAAATSAASLASPRYKDACKGAAVAAARVVSCAVSPPLSRDWVVVDVEICCR